MPKSAPEASAVSSRRPRDAGEAKTMSISMSGCSNWYSAISSRRVAIWLGSLSVVKKGITLGPSAEIVGEGSVIASARGACAVWQPARKMNARKSVQIALRLINILLSSVIKLKISPGHYHQYGHHHRRSRRRHSNLAGVKRQMANQDRQRGCTKQRATKGK